MRAERGCSRGGRKLNIRSTSSFGRVEKPTRYLQGLMAWSRRRTFRCSIVVAMLRRSLCADLRECKTLSHVWRAFVSVKQLRYRCQLEVRSDDESSLSSHFSTRPDVHPSGLEFVKEKHGLCCIPQDKRIQISDSLRLHMFENNSDDGSG